MKILGICGSPRKEKTSGTARLVQAVCEASGCEYEYISLKAGLDGIISRSPGGTGVGFLRTRGTPGPP